MKPRRIHCSDEPKILNAANDGFSSDVVAIDAVDVDDVGVGVTAVGAGKGVVIVDEGKVFAVVAGGGGCAVSVESILILSFSVALCFFSFSSRQLLVFNFSKTQWIESSL